MQRFVKDVPKRIYLYFVAVLKTSTSVFFFIFLRTLLYSFNYQVKKQRNIPHFAIIAIQSSRDEFSREKVAKGDKLFPETRVMVHVDKRNSIVRE